MPRIALSLIMLAALGCGGAEQLETAPVSGRVTLDGQPLSDGKVLFVPEAGRMATGEIQSDGRFTLGTYDDDDGPIVGPHEVAVQAMRSSAPKSEFSEDYRVEWLVPPRYATPSTSGLSFEVEPGTSNEAVFNLTSP